MFTFALQHNLIPGQSLREKFATLARWGYDGIEVSGSHLLEEADTLRQLSREFPVRITSACGGYHGWLADTNPRARALAIAEIGRMIVVAAEMGSAGLVVPAAYGLSARAGLPPARYPFTLEEDRARLIDSLVQALDYADRHGGTLLLEPLNRYEDRVLNTLDEAAAVIYEIGSPHLRLMPDLYHMNIEEANSPASLSRRADLIGHVHLADSNRQPPGQGHIDFAACFRVLRETGYTGALAVECKPPADPETVWPATLAFLRQAAQG